MFAGISPQVVLIGLACAVCVGSALYAARAWPISMRRSLRAAQDDVRELRANVERLESKWAARTAEIAGLIEEVEGALGSIEKKRRRIAAHESAEAAREQQNGHAADPQDPYAELRRRARAMGHPV